MGPNAYLDIQSRPEKMFALPKPTENTFSGLYNWVE